MNENESESRSYLCTLGTRDVALVYIHVASVGQCSDGL